MNVEKFILAIKNRPLMYVEQIRIDYIFYLLKGYVGSNLSIEEKKEIDYTNGIKLSKTTSRANQI